jgi:hypothetical protein
LGSAAFREPRDARLDVFVSGRLFAIILPFFVSQRDHCRDKPVRLTSVSRKTIKESTKERNLVFVQEAAK